MIEVVNTKDMLTVMGHAHDTGLLTKREVEACSAVTALVHTLIASMYELAHDEPDYEFDRGHFKLKKKTLAGSEPYINMFVLGIKVLTDPYGDLIHIDDQA
ncbi:MAG: ribosomal-processing cysteine protease Prp [Paludibacteraceae bacterium]|nr:ribosomal-processing cysteine protease Prp [Paludibacteraceae bacterium]MBQ7439121.1 ribosomal-processing cysteine protease Prp [Paludibacteraceae bacterium]